MAGTVIVDGIEHRPCVLGSCGLPAVGTTTPCMQGCAGSSFPRSLLRTLTSIVSFSTTLKFFVLFFSNITKA